MALEVDLTELSASANEVLVRGENFALAHASADTRLAAASSGWVGHSGRALGDRIEKWAQRTSALVARMGEQGNALHACVCAFGEHERAAANTMEAMRPNNSGQ